MRTGKIEDEGTPQHLRERVDIEGVYLGDNKPTQS